MLNHLDFAMQHVNTAGGVFNSSTAALSMSGTVSRAFLTLVQLLYASGEPIDPATLGEIASYADGIGPSVSNVDEALLTAAHERCLVVHPYTADDPVELTKLLDLGVDGIFTNRPDTLAPLADRHELAAPCP